MLKSSQLNEETLFKIKIQNKLKKGKVIWSDFCEMVEPRTFQYLFLYIKERKKNLQGENNAKHFIF